MEERDNSMNKNESIKLFLNIIEEPNSTNIDQNIVKKKKLFPIDRLLPKLKVSVDSMTIEEIKRFAEQNDLEPKVNFKLLQYLQKDEKKEYDNYIKKYKYTLNFKDAMMLNCLDKQKVKECVDLYNNNIEEYSLKSLSKIEKIEDIKCLSKLKLINLLLHLLNLDLSNLNAESFIKEISIHFIPISLLFKVPNKYGSIELFFYTLINFYINYFIKDFEIDENANAQNLSDVEKEMLFDFTKGDKIPEIDVDLSNFNKRKNELEEYIKIGFETKKKKSKVSKKKIDMKLSFALLKEKYFLLDKFQTTILHIIQEIDDNIIAQKLKFLYYNLQFISSEDFELIQKLNNSLMEQNFTEKEKNRIFKKYLIDIKNYDKNLALSNINHKFTPSLDNPFFNNSYFYKFPFLLNKNIIQNDEQIAKEFKNFLKYIYSSDLLKDIFYLTEEFNEFEYPFNNDEIFEEMISYTTFLPVNYTKLHGYTQKEYPDILIAVNMRKPFPKYSDLSDIICDLSEILTTCIHEQIKHYIKALIYYNSFRFHIKKRMNSDIYDFDTDKEYIYGILQKNGQEEMFNMSSLDGGHKAEIYLFGKILDKISYAQGFELFKMSNWTKTIPDHILNFNSLSNKNSREFHKVNNFLNNQDLCEFLKLFIKKFSEILIKDGMIVINYEASSGKREANYLIDNKENSLLIDYSASARFEGNSFGDASC